MSPCPVQIVSSTDGAHPVYGMGECIHSCCSSEHLRKANGQMWIEYGYVRIDNILNDIEFPADFFILYDRKIGHLAPGSGGAGGYCNMWYQRVHELIEGDVVDGFSPIGECHGHTLCRIDRASAAETHEYVCIHVSAELDGLVYNLISRIFHDLIEYADAHATHGLLNLVQNACIAYTFIRNNDGSFAVEPGYLLLEGNNTIRSSHKLCRSFKHKRLGRLLIIEHDREGIFLYAIG